MSSPVGSRRGDAALEDSPREPLEQLGWLAVLATISAYWSSGHVSDGALSFWNLISIGAFAGAFIVGWRAGQIAKFCMASVLSNLLARFLFLFDERAERGIYLMGVAVFVVAVAALTGAIFGRVVGRSTASSKRPSREETRPGGASKVQLPEIRIAPNRTLCPGCGEYSDGSMSQCPSCGGAISKISGSEKACCSKCGAITGGSHNFCSSCGVPVTGGA